MAPTMPVTGSARAVAPQLGEQVGPPERRPGAEAGHAVELGEGPQDDDVLIGRHQRRGRLGRLGEVDVGLVQEHDGPLRLVGDQVLDVVLGSDRPGRVVGVADVDQAGVGVGLGHRLDVVGVVLAERDADGLGSDEMRGPFAGLVAGVGDDEALARPGEGQDRAMERVARPGERHHMVIGKALDLGQRRDEREGFVVEVSPPLADDLVDRLGRLGAGAHGVFVGVDPDRVGRKVGHRREPLRQRRLVVERQAPRPPSTGPRGGRSRAG